MVYLLRSGERLVCNSISKDFRIYNEVVLKVKKYNTNMYFSSHFLSGSFLAEMLAYEVTYFTLIES
jgi:hypothetical protein